MWLKARLSNQSTFIQKLSVLNLTGQVIIVKVYLYVVYLFDIWLLQMSALSGNPTHPGVWVLSWNMESLKVCLSMIVITSLKSTIPYLPYN